MEENILTPDQVAQKLQVHPFTVLKFIKQGKLKASKLGRVYRIRESDVSRFLDDQSNGANRATGNGQSRPTKSESAKNESRSPRTPKTSTSKKIAVDGAPVTPPSLPIPPLKEVSPVSIHLESEPAEESFREITANISTTSPSISGMRPNEITSNFIPATSATMNAATATSKVKSTEQKTILPEDDNFLELDHYILD